MAAIMISTLPIIYVILPETKGVDLEMMQHLFKNQKTVFHIDWKPSDAEKNKNQLNITQTNGNK